MPAPLAPANSFLIVRCTVSPFRPWFVSNEKVNLGLPATSEQVTPDMIWTFCEKYLAAFKIPRFLEFRDELPKTPSSKVQKNILREESKQSSGKVFDRLGGAGRK